MMMYAPFPPIPQSQIPNVKKLCEDLVSSHRESNLKETTQSFRKRYKTKDGIPGRNLIEWRQAKTQEDLYYMAVEYMGSHRELFPAETANHSRFPKNTRKTFHLLMQLFWKQNTHETHNAKHPDRGRRVRESVESDQSSTTVASPTLPTFPRSKYLPAKAPQTSESVPSYPGIGVGSVPKGPFKDPLPRSEILIPTNKNVEGLNTAASTQSSGSLFVPRDEDTDEASTAPQGSTQTLIGSSPDLPDDVFAWPGNDSKRSAKTKATKLITSSFRHPFKVIEDDTDAATTVAPIAKMKSTPVPVQKTPKKSRPEQISPPSQMLNAQAGHGKPSPEANRRRGRDVDGDDEDAEYIPRPRSKRQKANSDASDNAPVIEGPPLSDPERRAPPTRQLATSGEDAVLPTRPRSKPPAAADTTSHNTEHQLAIPESPLNDEEPENPIEQAEEHLRTFLSRPAQQNPQPSPDRDPHPAERSLPSPVSNAAAPETIDPQQPVAYRSINDAGDLYSRGSSLERLPQTQPQPPPPAIPVPEINYYILAHHPPRISKIHWPSGSLANRSLDALFTQVSEVGSKNHVQRIICKLTTSTSDIQYTITRTDDKIYDIMKKAFSKDINADLAGGNMEFDIELELDPGKVIAPVEREERSVDFGFSF